MSPHVSDLNPPYTRDLRFCRAPLRRVRLILACKRQTEYTNIICKEACQVANIKSQKKRIKTNEIARQRNKAVKSELRTHVRNVRAAVAAGDAAKAAELAAVANRSLDKAVSKGVIHKNQAANRKSAISLSVAAL